MPGSPPSPVVEHVNELAGPPTVELLVALYVQDGHGHVLGLLDAALAMLAERRPGKTTAALALDRGSTDGTRERLRAWAAEPGAVPHRLVIEPPQPVGTGRALGLLLDAATRLEAGATVLVSGDLAAVSGAALAALAEPVLTGAAHAVAPAYTRTAGEGTLSTNLLAPLTAALYGRAVQQVVGGVLALATARLADAAAVARRLEPWDGPGAELWLTTTALASPVEVAQVHVGRRPPRAGGPEPDVPTIIAQTLAPLFAFMEREPDSWLETARVVPAPTIGEAPGLSADPERRDVERLVRAFRLGLKDLLPVWELCMSQATLGDLYPLALAPADEFALPPPLWARVVSDFAVAHREHRLPRDHLYRSLAPLYLGRVAAFFNELRREPDAPHAVLDRVGRAFEEERSGLVARWRE